MLDFLPASLRRPLWQAKHGLLSWFASRGLAEYQQYALQEHLRSRAISLVLDVGANTGQYARAVRRLGFDGSIVSFEPILRNIALLRAQASADPRWTIEGCALGAEGGTLEINVSAQTEFSSLLPSTAFGRNRFGAAISVAARELVEVRRLVDCWATVVPSSSARVHLKIDTQGFERPVLAGADGVLALVESIELEVSLQPLYEGESDWLEIIDYLKARKFSLSGFWPVCRSDDGTVVEADCLFVRTLDDA